MSTQAKPGPITEDEYIVRERAAEVKSEFYRGETFAMSGASYPHILLVSNLSGVLNGQLRSRSCRALTNDLKVRAGDGDLYAYPDIVVVCGRPQFRDQTTDVLVNPVLIIEVLSPSTRAYDQGLKFNSYRRIPSLMHYMTVEQEYRQIVHHRRQGEEWILRDYTAGTVIVSNPDCELPVDAVYDGIEMRGEPDANNEA